MMDHQGKAQFIHSYQNTRKLTEQLCAPLVTEDYVVQSIEDVSPPKWHLAHTTWFFETFILAQHDPHYKIFHESYAYLFNSYYQQLGRPYPRDKRGLLSRPTAKTIYAYRQYVDNCMREWIESLNEKKFDELKNTLALGLNHEQQHQELLLMDIKHNFSLHADHTVYHVDMKSTPVLSMPSPQFIPITGGLIKLGYQGNDFCFDNELPVHQQFVSDYLLSNRLVTNGEYLEFIEAGGYRQSQWWLSDGWDIVQKKHWQAPLYWKKSGKKWQLFSLKGLITFNENEPVSHVSFYEADAYARWRNCRLPTEAEWEHAVLTHAIDTKSGNFLEDRLFHPQASSTHSGDALHQLFGDLWEWTTSPYVPYPGYTPQKGALGEYNGKFMSNQIILRGGACVTPRSHIRSSYRNFFQPDKRWQFSGIRLAKNV
jgi:ergothioneine biosynthesis protein EgtB